MNLYKPKFKPKLKQRITTLILAATTMLTALPINALADTFVGNANGAVSADGTAGAHTYGTRYSAAITSWRVTLYVSTSDDGKIDPLTDRIGGTGLAKVGTVFYNNMFLPYYHYYNPSDGYYYVRYDTENGTPTYDDVFVTVTANTENRGAAFSNKMINTSKNRNQNTPAA